MNPKPDQAESNIFAPAINGILHCIREEKNCRIHLVFTIAALSANCILKISSLEWCLILFVIGSVWTAEIMNTAIERTIDLVTDEYHPLAKLGKDMAAGAVLISAGISVLTGLIIYLPKLFPFLQSVIELLR